MAPRRGEKEKEKNMTQKNSYTTAQGLAAAIRLVSKALKKGEDIRKIYPAEGTGCGGRWLSLTICAEIDSATTGEHIRSIYIYTGKANNGRIVAEF